MFYNFLQILGGVVFLKNICNNDDVCAREHGCSQFSGNTPSDYPAGVLIVQLLYFRILIGYRQRNMCLNRHPVTHS